MFKSNIRVVLGGVVLTDYDKHMEFEPELNHSRNVQHAPAIRAIHSRTFQRNNITNEFTFSRIEVHADEAATLYRMMEWTETLPTAEGLATIQWDNNTYEHNLHDASISSVAVKKRNFITEHTITLVGGYLQQLSP